MEEKKILPLPGIELRPSRPIATVPQLSGPSSLTVFTVASVTELSALAVPYCGLCANHGINIKESLELH
jgi:hypothetical protein